MNHSLLSLTIAVLAALPAVGAAPLKVVEDGKPMAVVVTAREPLPVASYACRELVEFRRAHEHANICDYLFAAGRERHDWNVDALLDASEEPGSETL
ncbi:MAG: hypothetical protein Q7S40_05615 [Opitutaceae bacterium]|nr:hypothetical protein [Opitutaceae bacterium]